MDLGGHGTVGKIAGENGDVDTLFKIWVEECKADLCTIAADGIAERGQGRAREFLLGFL